MRAHDVEFTLNSGDRKGKTYGYTLAVVDGRKQWRPVRGFRQPPSMIKYDIYMTITAAEDTLKTSGARQRERVNEIISQLEDIGKETSNVSLKGLDERVYPVLVDDRGIETETVMHEKTRDPEYRVHVHCYGMFE